MFNLSDFFFKQQINLYSNKLKRNKKDNLSIYYVMLNLQNLPSDVFLQRERIVSVFLNIVSPIPSLVFNAAILFLNNRSHI